MAVSINAFLSIEQSLSNRLETTWQRIYAEAVAKVSSAVNEGNFQQAEAVATGLDFAPVFDENREYIKYATYSAMLFGASRLVDDLSKSAVAAKSWAPLVDDVLAGMRRQIVDVAGEAVRDALLDDIAAIAEERRGLQLASIQKFNDGHTNLLGIFKFDPSQPRDPAGVSTGGQWVATMGLSSASTDVLDAARRNTKDLTDIFLSGGSSGEQKQRVTDGLYSRLANNPDFEAFVQAELKKRAGYTQAIPFDTGHYPLPLTPMDEAGQEDYDRTLIKAAISGLIGSWAGTSADASSIALAMQKCAKEVFGLKDVAEQHFHDDAEAVAEELLGDPVFKKGISLLLQAQYDWTQEFLRNQGITELYLTRGLVEYNKVPFEDIDRWENAPPGTVSVNDMFPTGDDVAVGKRSVQTQPMSSFSVSASVAARFVNNHEEYTPGVRGVMIFTRVPAERILSTSRTGFGCREELEVVVLGGTFPALTLNFADAESAFRVNSSTNEELDTAILAAVPRSQRDSFEAELYSIVPSPYIREGNEARNRKLWWRAVAGEAAAKNYRNKTRKAEKPKPLNLDEHLINADWVKSTWDLPPYKSAAFNALIRSLEDFRSLPVYQMAVANGLIKNDEWTGVSTVEKYDPSQPRDKRGRWVEAGGGLRTDTKEFKEWFGDSKIVDGNGAPRVVYHGTRKVFSEFASKYPDGLLFFTTNPQFASKWPEGIGPKGDLREPPPGSDDEYKRIREIEDRLHDQYVQPLEKYPSTPEGDAKFLADRKALADAVRRETGYGNATEFLSVAGLNVVPVYLSIQKPFDPKTDYKVVEDFIRNQGHGRDKLVEQGYHKNGNWIIYEDKGVIDELKRLGYDGIWLAEDTNGPHETIAAFSPEQIKSVFNQGTWDRKNRNISKEDRVLQPFVSFANTGTGYLQLVSQLHTSRLSAYGFTAEADVLEVDEYMVNEQLDPRTCPVCSEMHGKVFKVSDARRTLDVVLRVQDPNELKTLQPWPSQSPENIERIRNMTSQELVNRNWHVPPYHPFCRGLLVHVGEAPKLKPLVEYQQQEKPEFELHNISTTQEIGSSLQEYGFQFNDSAVQRWSDRIAMAPTVFFASVVGDTADDFLQEIYGEGAEGLPSAGIDFVDWDGDSMILGGSKIAGMPTQWEVALDFSANTWRVNNLSVEEYDLRKKIVQNWSELFNYMGLRSVG